VQRGCPPLLSAKNFGRRVFRISNEAVALEKAYLVTKWLMERASRFPKNRRYTLGTRIEDLSLDILLGLVEASYVSRKQNLLRKTNLDLEKLRYLVRLSKDFGLLSIKQHEYICKELTELGRQVGGWEKHQRQKEKD